MNTRGTRQKVYGSALLQKGFGFFVVITLCFCGADISSLDSFKGQTTRVHYQDTAYGMAFVHVDTQSRERW